MSLGLVELDTERLEILRIAPERPGATLVFLHEGLGSIAGWRDFPQTVCARLGRPGLVYSRLGHGRSTPLSAPRASDYLHREAWQVLPALLERLGIKRPLLVGHSDGASIALLYAARFEPRAIALLAPHVFVEPITLAGVAAARAAWQAGRLGAGLARLHDDPDGAFRGWCEIWLAPGFRDWNIEAELARVSCPVLAIQGRGDQYGSEAQIEAIAAGVAGEFESLMLEDCGHAPQRDQTDAVIRALAALASRIAPL